MEIDWQNLIQFFGDQAWLVSLIAPTVSGENGVLVLAFLSAQQWLSIWVVIIFSFLGMLLIDSFWFVIMKFSFFKKWKSKVEITEKYKNLETKIEKITHKQDMYILFISKLLIGTRILIIAFISLRKMSYQKFIKYDLVPTFVWACILSAFGWFAGKGYYDLKQTFNNFTLAIIFVVIVVAIFYAIIKLIQNKITR